MIVVTDTDRLASASQPVCVNELPVLFLRNRRGMEVALKGAIIILTAVYIMSSGSNEQFKNRKIDSKQV